MPDQLPWSEVLRRRNGLPAAEDDVAVLRSVGLDRSAQPLDTEPEAEYGQLVSVRDVRPGSDLHRVVWARPEPRCDLYDLPTTMCHHCKETSTDA